MAALLIVAALGIVQKIDDRKERKRQKKAYDDERYRGLQEETARQNRLEKKSRSRRNSDASHTESVDEKAVPSDEAQASPASTQRVSSQTLEQQQQRALPIAPAEKYDTRPVRQNVIRSQSGRLIDI